jgi:hypothetical protein
MLEHKLPAIDVPPTERSRFNYYRFHKPLEVMKAASDPTTPQGRAMHDDYHSFMFHDLSNVMTGTTSYAGTFVDILTSNAGGQYAETQKKLPPDVLIHLKEQGPRILEAVNRCNLMINMYDMDFLAKSTDDMQLFADFMASEDAKIALSLPDFAPIRDRLVGIPESIKLGKAFVRAVHYLDNGDPSLLHQMQENKMVLGDALVKTKIKAPADVSAVSLSEADVVIMTSVASKFVADVVGGGVEWNAGDKVSNISIAYDKKTGDITFEYPYDSVDPPRRIARYMQKPEERDVPSIDSLTSAFSKISPGLYAAELLGYATGRNLSFEIADGKALFKIQKVKKEQVPVFDIHHAVGERAGYREIHEQDATDMLRMWEIDQQNPNADALGKPSSTEYALKRWLMKTKRKEGVHMYAVTTQERADGSTVESSKRGEIEGWIRTDETAEERERYMRIANAAIDDVVPVTELSSIKRIDPDMPQGLISSARRQILLDILRSDVQNGLYVGTKGNVVRPKRIVTAYVNVENDDREGAIRSLEASGFRRAKDRVEWIQGDEESICDMYVLDWEKLQQIEAEKTKKSVLERLQTLSGTSSGLDIQPNTPHENDAAILERIRRQIRKSK